MKPSRGPDHRGPDDHSGLDPVDEALVAGQLGRSPRGALATGWRCPCGAPGVVVTAPRLPDGSPFPTTYYLTCPQATAACSTLEATGVMAEWTAELAADEELRTAYGVAHEHYLADRATLGDVPEVAGTSAGGMPERVKCLHALLAHALAAGPGVNPLGDRTATLVGEFWRRRPCAPLLRNGEPG